MNERIYDCDFSFCVLNNICFNDTTFRANNLLILHGVEFYNVNFNNCIFDRHQFKNCLFFGVKFIDNNLAEAPISRAIFENCIFQDCDFSHNQLHGGMFFNCYFNYLKLPDLHVQKAHYMDPMRGHLNNSLSFLCKEVSKGYKSSGDKRKSIYYFYLSKKYKIYHEFLSPKLVNIDTKLKIYLFFLLFIKDLMAWINYYVLGFGLKPLRVLKWYAPIIIVSVVFFCLKGMHFKDAIILELDAVFTYGFSFLDNEIIKGFDVLTYFIFWVNSFLGLVLHGLFITSLFYYLSSDNEIA